MARIEAHHGAPYRTIDEPTAVERPPRAAWTAVEGIAWFVLMQTAFTRALLGLVRPDLDALDTALACLCCVLASIALGLRVRR